VPAVNLLACALYGINRQRHGRRRARHCAQGRRECGVQSGGLLQGYLAVLACHRHRAAGRCALWVRPSDHQAAPTSGTGRAARQTCFVPPPQSIGLSTHRLGYPLHTRGGGRGRSVVNDLRGARRPPDACVRYTANATCRRRRGMLYPSSRRTARLSAQPALTAPPQRWGVSDAHVQRTNRGGARRAETGAECGADRRSEGAPHQQRSLGPPQGCSPSPGGAWPRHRAVRFSGRRESSI
jgi:hypothetical protein